MKHYKLISVLTGKKINEKKSVTTDPDCGGPLEVVYDYNLLKKSINSYIFESTPISSRKYLDFYPIKDYQNIITLNEGATPLYKSVSIGNELRIPNLYFKHEGANPTGSFKDRGSMVEVTKAKELGAKGIIFASTGNMAASVAAYAAKAGIDCYVLVPEGTPSGKLAQTLSYGAKVIQVHGDYMTAANLAAKVAKKYGFYLAGDYCFRQEGQKSQAYEIIEQLHFKIPDYILVPCGVGTNMSAIWKGFVEYKILGLIKTVPRMIAVQAEGASPIIKTFNLDLSEFAVEKKPKTVSSAIAVGNPLDAVKVIKLLKYSKGLAVSVSDEETLECQQELGMKESLFVEPSSATTLAALRKLKKERKLKKNATYVCVLTGTGLKDTASALKILAEPPTVDPEIEEVDALLSSDILKIRSYGARRREEIILKKTPTKKELTHILKKKFDFTASKDYIQEIDSQIKRFLRKGKKITRADVQFIIENTLQTFIPEAERTLKILDFEIKTRYEKVPLAIMKVKVHGDIISTKSKGTGPVDASINALQKACKRNGNFEVELTDYNVRINTKGTDAAVDVDMKLESDKGDKVVGSGTSPDIIQASIDAFVSGYNVLSQKARERKLGKKMN